MGKSSFPDGQEIVSGWTRDCSRMGTNSFPSKRELVPRYKKSGPRWERICSRMNKSPFSNVEGIRTTLSSFSYSDASFGSAGLHLKSALVGIRLNVTTTHRIKGQWTLFRTDTLKRPIQLHLALSIEITLEKGARSWERKRRWQEKKEDELFYSLTSSCQARLFSLSRRQQV